MAFCFTGQPRTFLHPEAQASIARALRSFGGHAYTFFVLTDDDSGSSWQHPAVRAQAARVHEAMGSLHPMHVTYGPLPLGLKSYAAERREQCGMSPDGVEPSPRPEHHPHPQP